MVFHVIIVLRREQPKKRTRIMPLGKSLSGAHNLDGHKFVALSLKSVDNFADDTSLHTIRLDCYKCPFVSAWSQCGQKDMRKWATTQKNWRKDTTSEEVGDLVPGIPVSGTFSWAWTLLSWRSENSWIINVKAKIGIVGGKHTVETKAQSSWASN